ncbi:MAG: peptide-methionine (S)-S-oxide reductase MsrA [Thermoleophilaceae bacterium]|nr:peptide-methionine (S)-S-oxide reductase MsrA [Thermoleophilaceae bacterium]
MLFFGKEPRMVEASDALPGRAQAIAVPERHFVLGNPLKGPWPPGIEQAIFAMGCFWGAERQFWELPGVYSTAVGYVAGMTENPTYEEVCSGLTGHTEAVLVAFIPSKVSYEDLLKAFWEGHDPTQGMGQGNDIGTQYRSGIYTEGEAQAAQAEASRVMFQTALGKAGYDAITTEIKPATEFFYAEEYHQQYLAKNPGGYCGLGGTGVSCPIGLAT